MRKFTMSEKRNGEMAMRSLSELAWEFYSNTDPLDVIEVLVESKDEDSEDEKRYYVRGAYEWDNLTFEELEEHFENIQRDILEEIANEETEEEE